MNNADNPAMPIVDDKISTHEKEIYLGLTKREVFAMNAMQGLIAANSKYEGRTGNITLLSEAAVAHADLLLKELEK